MAEIKFAPGDLSKVPAKLAELMAGQSVPFEVTFKHTHKRGVVLPRVEHYDVIPANTETMLVVNSEQQAFDLCSDLAYMAEHYKAEAFGSLTTSGKSAQKQVAAKDAAKELSVEVNTQ